MTRVDRQTLTVLVLAAFLCLWKFTLGSADFFDQYLAPRLAVEVGSLWSYAYHFGTQAVVGFVVPVAVLLGVFKRRPTEIGLGMGNVRVALGALVLYLPIVVFGCWLFAHQPGFQDRYPMFVGAATSWSRFIAFELLFVLYWVGWEYLWRGFVLFGTAPTFGRWAIVIQMLPFAALHAQKPMAEAFLSIPGALLLGALVWYCRSFWVAVPIHALQMLAMDYFCVLQQRTGP